MIKNQIESLEEWEVPGKNKYKKIIRYRLHNKPIYEEIICYFNKNIIFDELLELEILEYKIGLKNIANYYVK